MCEVETSASEIQCTRYFANINIILTVIKQQRFKFGAIFFEKHLEFNSNLTFFILYSLYYKIQIDSSEGSSWVTFQFEKVTSQNMIFEVYSYIKRNLWTRASALKILMDWWKCIVVRLVHGSARRNAEFLNEKMIHQTGRWNWFQADGCRCWDFLGHIKVPS